MMIYHMQDACIYYLFFLTNIITYDTKVSYIFTNNRLIDNLPLPDP